MDAIMTDVTNVFNNKKYAIVKDNKVVDCVLIHADDVESMLPTAIEVNQADEAIEVIDELAWLGVGCVKDNNIWRHPKAYDSWVWGSQDWEAPVPKPEGEHIWNEIMLSWIPIPQMSGE